ncbi:hypothetical protein B9479_002442 [Cryptococcus floricola]|uniref:Retroviral polymerase SH3-like domain-containing protein n=1 Tax=Cryptococcus floricola TaxID=2591691 RepID=A0A5D3B189_9TREE|nr:hypothetical protein B9479_002442 [Cryptococcus floricola]
MSRQAHMPKTVASSVYTSILNLVRANLIQARLPRTPAIPVRHDHLQPFGCRLYFRDHQNPNKLFPRYREGVLVGYVEGTRNYRIWDTTTNNIVVSRDVRFSSLPSTPLDYVPDVDNPPTQAGAPLAVITTEDVTPTSELAVPPPRPASPASSVVTIAIPAPADAPPDPAPPAANHQG